MNNTTNTPMVSVCMITYNHEAYIGEAIEGVLMQKANFPFKLIIGEDHSTDNTRAICEKYAAKHPDVIELLPKEEINLGMMPNFIKTLKVCKGKYIALCEGDDYWIDENKLQMQVDFLEENEEYSLVFTNRHILNPSGILSNSIGTIDTYTKDDILKGFIPWTQTILLRNNKIIPSFLRKHNQCPSGDRLISYICSTLGPLKRLDNITAVYRDSGYGVWSSIPVKDKLKTSTERYIDFINMVKPNNSTELINLKINKAKLEFLRKKPISYIINMIYDNIFTKRTSFTLFLFNSFTKKYLKS
ncbi:glycosyltransferase family 2 protein [Saccharicrinis aurantiacus]|uniref:glycosyltransferase family 2 protein n=1 Tax=Saccharicrinis aurantiacus TaxID=1849719 RepID=UPI00248F6F4C|nr:glycosyltransferase [Saccharicrinis aurantiacus]